MSEVKSNRTRTIRVRVTPEEWDNIQKKFNQTTYRKLSDYIRKKLLDKPVVVYQRNQSLDEFMAEIMLLKNELNAIGNNYNQVVKRLHSMYDYSEIKYWLLIHESNWNFMQIKVEEIKLKINQINDQWLRS